MKENHLEFCQQVTFIGVEDLTRSTRFYGERLGLTLTLDQGACRIFRCAGSAYIGVCTGLQPAPTDEIILTLVTPHVEQWHARLRDHVEVDGLPRYNKAYNITHFFMRDPDGYRLEIQCFHDPRWPSAVPPARC